MELFVPLGHVGLKLSEFEQIREALGLTLDEMAVALDSTHATVHRWESAPNTRSGKQALEAAKALYKKRKKQEWKAPEARLEAAAGLNQNEIAALQREVDLLRKDLKSAERVQYALIGAVRQLAKAAGLSHLAESLE